ncbi:MAG: hypothetical protein ACP5GJ_02445 [Nanopusillaceae archaeon]
MGWKDKMMGEIRLYVEMLRKKGLAVEYEEYWKKIKLRVYYTNLGYQRKIIDELMKKHNIPKSYIDKIYYLEKYYYEYIKLRYLKVDYWINKRNLKDLLEKLKSIYNNYNEEENLKYIKNVIDSNVKLILDEVEDLRKKEKEKRKKLKLYLDYLNGKIDYSKEIKDIEGWLSDTKLKYSKKVREFIKGKIEGLLNNKNIKIFKIENGIALVMTYEDKYFKGGWNYENNKFYLVDIRNGNYKDISNIITKKVDTENNILELLGPDEIYRLENINIIELLV